MIRTTITMPKHIHQILRSEALEKGQSFNDLLLEKITKDKNVDLKKSLARIKKITKGMNFNGIDYKELTHYGHKY